MGSWEPSNTETPANGRKVVPWREMGGGCSRLGKQFPASLYSERLQSQQTFLSQKQQQQSSESKIYKPISLPNSGRFFIYFFLTANQNHCFMAGEAEMKTRPARHPAGRSSTSLTDQPSSRRPPGWLLVGPPCSHHPKPSPGPLGMPAPAPQRCVGKSPDFHLLPLVNSRAGILFSKGIQLWCQQKSKGMGQCCI